MLTGVWWQRGIHCDLTMSLLAHPSLGLLASACGSVNFLLLTQRPEEHRSHLPCKVTLFHTPTVALSPLSPVRSCVLTGLPAPTHPLPATHTLDSESDWKGKARLCCHLTILRNPHTGPHTGLRTGPSTEPGFSVYKVLWLLLPASGSSRMFYQPNYSSLQTSQTHSLSLLLTNPSVWSTILSPYWAQFDQLIN